MSFRVDRHQYIQRYNEGKDDLGIFDQHFYREILLQVGCEDQYDSHVCTLNMNLQLAAA